MTLLAIDGPAGAGKTTLAAQFEADFLLNKSVKTIHMDDLYNGWDGALSYELTSTLSKIVEAHLNGVDFIIRKYNWFTLCFDSTEKILMTDILILEGVGAAQSIVRAAGATTYWLDVSPKIGLERVLQRDGRHLEPQMKNWQIQQENHFLLDQTRENCDVKVS